MAEQYKIAAFYKFRDMSDLGDLKVVADEIRRPDEGKRGYRHDHSGG